MSQASGIADKLMKSAGQTIAAVSTPAGMGGIGIVRLSGPDSLSMALELFRPTKNGLKQTGLEPRRMYLGHILSPGTAEPIDEVLLVYFKAPHSYTTQDLVEIHCHGGSYSSAAILEALRGLGAREAYAGEFSYRALLGGRLDLSQAEGIASLIGARSRVEGRLALGALRGQVSRAVDKIRQLILELAAQIEVGIDFPEDYEDIRPGQIKAKLTKAQDFTAGLLESYRDKRPFIEGANVVIYGRPNVGKSSLFNRLLGNDRAIVSHIAGTTRDCLHQEVVIRGVTCRLIDSAGFDGKPDELSKKARQQAEQFLQNSDLSLLILDQSVPLTSEDHDLLAEVERNNRLLVLNKRDLTCGLTPDDQAVLESACRVSALTGQGLEELEQAIKDRLCGDSNEPAPGEVVVNRRQSRALQQTLEHIDRAAGHLERPDLGLELISLDLQLALSCLDMVDGASSVEQVIEQVFDRFCVGK